MRKFSHERRNSQNLIAARQRGIFHQIDDFDVILTFQIFLANFFEILEGGERAGRLAGYIETQIPTVRIVAVGLRRIGDSLRVALCFVGAFILRFLSVLFWHHFLPFVCPRLSA